MTKHFMRGLPYIRASDRAGPRTENYLPTAAHYLHELLRQQYLTLDKEEAEISS